MKTKILITAVTFLVFLGFYHFAQALISNDFPPNTQAGVGGIECRHLSGASQNCNFNSIVVIDYNNYQGYELSIGAPFVNVMNTPATLEVWGCMSMSGIMWTGLCWTFFDVLWGSEGIYNLGTRTEGIGSDETYPGASAGLSIRVANVNPAVIDITMRGRRVHIDNFDVPLGAVQNSAFTVNWGTTWANLAPNRVNFSFPAGISCSASGFVAPSGSATCTGTQLGTYTLTLQATGPAGIFETPNTVEVQRTITISPPTLCGNGVIDAGEQCDGGNLNGQSCPSQGYAGGTLSCKPPGDPNQCTFDLSNCGRNKCLAPLSCSFVSELGPNQCGVASDCVAAACNGGVDVGLRLYQDGVRRVAVEPGAPTSLLRVFKDAVRGVVLVDPADSNASKMRIQTPAGVRSLCLLPGV